MKIAYLSAILVYSIIKLLIICDEYTAVNSVKQNLILAEDNAEAKLATGRKLKLSKVDLYDLELIPGISDKLGLAILEKRENIIYCSSLADKQKNDAHDKTKKKCPLNPFKLVHGIGEAKSSYLLNFLELN